MIKRTCNIFLIFSFFMIIIIPMIYVNRVNGEVLEYEQRVSTDFPVVFNEAGEFVFKFNDLELWLNDNLGFRNEFVKMNSLLQTEILKKSPVDLVYMGLDGWLFYTGDNNLLLNDPKNNITEEELNVIEKNQLELIKYFESKDIEYYLLVPPSKVSVYPEYIFPNEKIKKTNTDIIYNYLNEADIKNMIDLKSSLIDEKNNEQLYFKTDTHWTYYASYIAYTDIHDRFVEDKIIDSDVKQIELYSDTYLGDMNYMLSKNETKDLEEFNNVKILNSKADVNEEYEKKYELDIQYLNNDKKLDNILLYGDSFIYSSKLGTLLAEHFYETTILTEYIITDEVINEYDPDVVIIETTERLYGRLLNIMPQ